MRKSSSKPTAHQGNHFAAEQNELKQRNRKRTGRSGEGPTGLRAPGGGTEQRGAAGTCATTTPVVRSGLHQPCLREGRFAYGLEVGCSMQHV